LDRARGLGLEGLIGKRGGSPYEPGKRSGAWIKIKLHLEQEFVIGGYTEPEGLGNISARSWSASTKAKNLNLLAESGPGLAKNSFYNLPAAGRNRWDQGLTAAEMRRCHWVKSVMVRQVKFTDTG
jgi:bifunctional non-homologous end joining protein LigD